MNYGLYLAASAALSETYRQEILTNNLVNAQTVGFKPDMVYGRQRLPQRLESGEAIEPQLLLERLGGSPALNPTYVNVQQGALIQTGNELDTALDGEGFFVVRGSDGQAQLTRDGRFALDVNGDLVMAGSGRFVLDASNQPIRLARNQPAVINDFGQILQGGKVRAELRITPPIDPRDLVKAGENLLRHRDGKLPRGARAAAVRQSYVEASSVDPVVTLKDLLITSRSLSAAVKMMQHHDNLMGQAINTMGRVA